MCRREGMKLYLKGEKCLTKKCPVERRPVPPGQHGQRRRKQSEYSLHLREKQKARRIYGVLEDQFQRTFNEAQRRPGITGTGRKTDIPSFRCRPNDRIAVSEGARNKEYFKTVADLIRQRSIPGWLSLDPEHLQGTVLSIPERSDCDQNINDQLVVEYYSR